MENTLKKQNEHIQHG